MNPLKGLRLTRRGELVRDVVVGCVAAPLFILWLGFVIGVLP